MPQMCLTQQKIESNRFVNNSMTQPEVYTAENFQQTVDNICFCFGSWNTELGQIHMHPDPDLLNIHTQKSYEVFFLEKNFVAQVY